MFFRNLAVFKTQAAVIDSEDLRQKLAALALQPCDSQQPETVGWVPAHADELVHVVNRQILIAMGTEEKLLPASVVKQFAADKARAIEEAEGRRVGRKELRDIREAVTQELLPRAFVRRSTTYAWLDPVNGWLAIDAGSLNKAEAVLELLRKSVDGFPATLVKTVTSPSSAMTGWVAQNEAPSGFTIDVDSELRSAENAVIRYTRHSLEGKEVRDHISEGKVVTRLGLTWNDRISFVLDEKLLVKRLGFLDILKEENDGQAENEDERFDLDFTLMTGELAKLLADLVAALGGAPSEE